MRSQHVHPLSRNGYVIRFSLFLLDTGVPTYVRASGSNSGLRSSIKCAKPSRSPTPQSINETSLTVKTATKRSHQAALEPSPQESIKRARLLSRTTDDNGLNTNRIVLRIRKTSEDLSSSRSETSNSSVSSHQLTVQIKEPLLTLREDEESDEISQSSLHISDSCDQTDQMSSDDKEENE